MDARIGGGAAGAEIEVGRFGAEAGEPRGGLLQEIFAGPVEGVGTGLERIEGCPAGDAVAEGWTAGGGPGFGTQPADGVGEGGGEKGLACGPCARKIRIPGQSLPASRQLARIHVPSPAQVLRILGMRRLEGQNVEDHQRRRVCRRTGEKGLRQGIGLRRERGAQPQVVPSPRGLGVEHVGPEVVTHDRAADDDSIDVSAVGSLPQQRVVFRYSSGGVVDARGRIRQPTCRHHERKNAEHANDEGPSAVLSHGAGQFSKVARRASPRRQLYLRAPEARKWLSS